MAADHYNGRSGVKLAEALERLHSVHSRHFHVEKNEMRPPLLVLRDPIRGVGDRTHVVTLVLQKLAEGGANPLLVVDNEDSSTHRVVL
jgi:hypothetical protein